MKKSNYSRSNQMWAITIPKCEFKEFFYLGLIDLANRLVVAQETHFDKTFHLHIFLDLKEKLNFNQIKDFLSDAFSSIEDPRTDVGNIQTVKSSTQWISYCLKFDKDPKIFNIDHPKLTFWHDLAEWLKTSINHNFQLSDQFVINHSNIHSFLKSIHEEEKRNIGRIEYLGLIYLPFMKKMFNSKIEIISWYNNFITAKEHLHSWLCGPHLSGKTSFGMSLLNTLLKNFNQFFIISDDPSYPFGHYIPGYHLISFNDDFDPNYYKMGLVKKAVKREYFNQNVKYEKTKIIQISIPFIFISDKKPESKNDITSFINVLKIIEIKNN